MNKNIIYLIFFFANFNINAQSSKTLTFGEAQTHIPIQQKEKHIYTFSLKKGDFVQFSIGYNDIWMGSHLVIGKDTIPFLNEWSKDKYVFYAPKSGQYTATIYAIEDTANIKQGVYHILCERMLAKEREKIDKQSLAEGEVVTSDIVRFWNTYDKLNLCKTLQDSVEMLSKHYFMVGTSSFQGSIKMRPMTAFDMANTLKEFPKFYASLRKNSMSVVQVKPHVQEIFNRFKKLYPRFVSAKAHFHVGILKFAGTLDSNTLYVGSDVAFSDKNCDFSEIDVKIPAFAPILKRDKPLDRMVLEIIAHEGVHIQQYDKQPKKHNCDLLAAVINEGAADFIGELLAGSHINPTIKSYGDAHEKELWDMLNNNLCDGNYGQFLYNYGSTERGNMPPDMGYYIGYKICESYYKNAPDKAQAVVDIIEMNDVKTFLTKSKYAEAAKNTTPQDSCNCLLNLNHFIEKVTTNYAGYHDKVNDRTLKKYNALIDSLRQKATEATNLRTCYDILERYRLFFYDKHLQLSANMPPKNVDMPNHKATQTAWREASVMAYFEKNKGKLTDIEGIWTDGSYKVAVIENAQNNTFEGIILASQNANFKEGMLKFTNTDFNKQGTYQTIYVRGDLALDTVQTTVFKNYMEIDRYGSWKKTYPILSDTLNFSQIHERFSEVQMRLLNKNTLYIRLKSCNIENKPILDTLVKMYQKELQSIPYWIVDFRSNGGGSTDVYQSLLPYLYTKSRIYKGNLYRMTPEHNEKFKTFFAETKQYLDSATNSYVQKMIEFGDKNPNSWYDDGGDTLKFDKILPFPKRVAVLSDRYNASSGESFLIDAKGLSDKVTIFGENSGGYLDYGNLNDFNMPCDKFYLYIPSSKAKRLNGGETYDATGYPPDVQIPENTKDWIQFVQNYWQKQGK